MPLGSIQVLAELSSLTALLAFPAVNLALMVLRYRLPDQDRPFRVPFSVGRMPIVPVVAVASIGVLMANFDWEIYALGCGIVLASCLIYVVQRMSRRARRTLLSES